MKFISLLLILFSINGFAQEAQEEEPNSFLVIKPFESRLVAPLEESNINKTILRVATKQKDYQLSLSPDVDFVGVRSKVYSVSIFLAKKGIVYTVKAFLHNLKKNEVDFEVTRENVNRNRVQREVEVALEMLFEGGEKVKEEKVRPKNKIIKGDNKMKPVDTGLAAFKQRVLSIKKALQKKFNQIKKKLNKEQEEQEQEEKEKEAKKKKITDAQESKNKPRNKKLPPNPTPKDNLSMLEEFNYLGAGYWDHDIQSNYLVDTNTYIPLYNVMYKKGFFLDENSTFYHLYTFNYGTPADEYDIEVEPSMNISGGLGVKSDTLRLQSELHLSYHTMTFGNLTEAGGGIVAAAHTHYWADVHLGFRTLMGRFPLKFNAYYGTILKGDSTFPNLDGPSIKGTRIGLEFLMFRAWKMISIMGGWYTMDISVQRKEPLTIGKFTYNEMTVNGTSMQLSGVYTY